MLIVRGLIIMLIVKFKFNILIKDYLIRYNGQNG